MAGDDEAENCRETAERRRCAASLILGALLVVVEEESGAMMWWAVVAGMVMCGEKSRGFMYLLSWRLCLYMYLSGRDWIICSGQ